MAEKPTPEEIVEALDSSGYLMEQEVASRFEALGYHVRTNRPYTDPDEGKSREIDVTAIKTIWRDETAKIAVFVEFVVECKNSTLPYVFITRPKNVADARFEPREIVFPIAEYREMESMPDRKVRVHSAKAFFDLGLTDSHFHMANPNKAIQFCRIDRKGKGWTATHSGLYDSIFLPIIKAFEARRGTVPRHPDRGDWHFVWIFVPTVVIRGDLYSVDSEAKPAEPVPSKHISFIRDFKSDKLDHRYVVEFVDDQHLEAFVQDVIEPFASKVSERIEADIPRFKKPQRQRLEKIEAA